MADVHNIATRRKNMRAIRNHDTAIEIVLSGILLDLGFSFLTQVKTLPGKPDFVIDEYKKIIFTHGCFWHQHNCYLFKTPSTRTEFWLEKTSKNYHRDQLVNEKLKADGWNILVIWECAIRGRLKLARQELSDRVEEWVCAGTYSAEIDTTGIHNKNV